MPWADSFPRGEMDQERLRQIIIEEILRAVAEVRARHGVAPAAPSRPVSAGREAVTGRAALAPPAAPGDHGVVVLTGDAPPAGSAREALSEIAAAGRKLFALPSLSFRLTHPDVAGIAAPARVVADPDDERAMRSLAGRCAFALAPDISINTLNKCLGGIEDSAPARMIARFLREKKHVLLIESGEGVSPVARRARIDLLRELVRSGATLCSPGDAAGTLAELLRPEEDRWFKPKPPKPPQRFRVITKDDIIALRQARKIELVLSAGTIVTGEAREFAARWGIRLRREEE